MRTSTLLHAGVLSHRLIVRPEAEVEGKRVEEIVAELIHSVPVLEMAPKPASVIPVARAIPTSRR